MKCPHCLTSIHVDDTTTYAGKDVEGEWLLQSSLCPSCHKLILILTNAESANYDPDNDRWLLTGKTNSRFVRPKFPSRSPCPIEVPDDLATDYNEACLILYDSPKASAALSRRCLQNLLREIVKVKPGNLADEIQQVMNSMSLPSHLFDSIDAIRNIGNFAAHPVKSQKTGEIFPVEPGEAEWNLDVLEALFDFYFVQPEMIKKKRAALDQKLKDAGKKPMK
jgi:hypothetical protein